MTDTPSAIGRRTGVTVMHLHSLHKHRVDWINWLGDRPLLFWVISLSPWLAIIWALGYADKVFWLDIAFPWMVLGGGSAWLWRLTDWKTCEPSAHSDKWMSRKFDCLPRTLRRLRGNGRYCWTAVRSQAACPQARRKTPIRQPMRRCLNSNGTWLTSFPNAPRDPNQLGKPIIE